MRQGFRNQERKTFGKKRNGNTVVNTQHQTNITKEHPTQQVNTEILTNSSTDKPNCDSQSNGDDLLTDLFLKRNQAIIDPETYRS